MTQQDNTDALRDKALQVHRRLANEYGEPEWHQRLDPVSELVSTIISQNTSDTNRDVAFERLQERFPTWEAVRDAPVDEVKAAIRPAGLANQKAPRIQRALEAVSTESGEPSLDFLEDMDVDEAKRWLTQIKGIGPKTAAIVLLFALNRPAFPVDTHVHRVSGRIGLIGDKTSREKAHDELESLLPEELYYPFHVNLIRHGRRVCVARNPKCEICVVQDLCDYYADVVSDQ